MFKTASLTPEVQKIIINKGTEYCNSGIYTENDGKGTYLCRNCGVSLFRSEDKFHSGSGWPSFDHEITGKVKKIKDKDGVRTEVICDNCGGHLGHVFYGEGYTKHNTRYCINSLALEFILNTDIDITEEAILSAGCFWGVEHLLSKLSGVLKTEVGYTGGVIKNPTYELVCTSKSGHVEALRVVYDPKIINYEHIIKYFFEIHDFSQVNGQGNDIGSQYLSRIYYFNEGQRDTATQIVDLLKSKKYDIATEIKPAEVFWAGEEYHQKYYDKTGGIPYCHIWRKIF